jgi:agmatinase
LSFYSNQYREHDLSFDPNRAGTTEAGIFGLPYSADESAVVLMPVPFDATTSYRPGTANGPQAILEASRQVDLFDVETGNPWSAGIALLPEAKEIHGWNDAARGAAERAMALREDEEARAGDVQRVNDLCARVNGLVHGEVSKWLDIGKVVGTIGGDHGCVYGAIAAHAERYSILGILHVDAHADLRNAYDEFEWSHASIMDNVCRRHPNVVRLVQVGVRDLCEEERECIAASAGRIKTHYDAELVRERFAGVTWTDQVTRMIEDLPEQVYVSFDIDGLDPALCPNTGTPVPGGLSFNQAVYLVAAVALSGRQIVGFDLSEVAPGTAADQWDGNVGSRILYKLIGWTLRSRNISTSDRS